MLQLIRFVVILQEAVSSLIEAQTNARFTLTRGYPAEQQLIVYSCDLSGLPVRCIVSGLSVRCVISGLPVRCVVSGLPVRCVVSGLPVCCVISVTQSQKTIT